ncbi:MAG TPA: diguanylate cyclase [Pyrinomonadaceae bacterium]|nr:diguanylate cyclase [Pyrinomonadaceae bacterium]
MDETVVPSRGKAQTQNDRLPTDWADVQASLSAASGLALLLVEGHQPPAVLVSNNNSICRAFQSSPDYVRLCDPFCGVAFERARHAEGIVHYRCHAGLHCFAMPVEAEGNRQQAVIGGRAFLTSADYRALAERFRTGDLQDLLSGEIFQNVIFAARQDLDELARRIEEATGRLKKRERAGERAETPPPTAAVAAKPEAEAENLREDASAKHERGASDSSVEQQPARRLVESRSALMHTRYFQAESDFKEACSASLEVLAGKHKLVSLALLLRERGTFVPACFKGRFEKIPVHIEIGLKDARLFATAKAASSLVLRETAEGFKPAGTVRKQTADAPEKTAELFPLIVGDEVKAALLVGDSELTDEKRRAISAYCREIALPLEVLRLRHELEQRARFAEHVQNFGERINTAGAGETYDAILRMSADLLHAERGSLLLFDEASNELAVKAAVGPRAEVSREARVRMGEGVAGSVMVEGRPLVVRDVEEGGHTPAPAERSYKTKSFISYPISIGGRKVGVLNVTDKAGGGSYDDIDLSLLESIAPQMAMAMDRAEWQEKANQFQLMSITDPLTGMLNRRYLIERLAEELKRSKRQEYPMSFMMIDIDDFKLYNDRNGHPAGDLALEMTAQCLKSALRSADVASRYGGEEFCILLPQTSLEEGISIAERIRRRITRVRFPHGKSQPLGSVTVSIGVSAFGPDLETPQTIIEAADRALYLAKSRGKNRVESLDAPGAEVKDAAEEA